MARKSLAKLLPAAYASHRTTGLELIVSGVLNMTQLFVDGAFKDYSSSELAETMRQRSGANESLKTDPWPVVVITCLYQLFK